MDVYVVEILERCAALAECTARVYRKLAERFQGDQDRVRLWRELALEEETHADILRRELESFQSDERSGAFLPEYADRLGRLDVELGQLEARAAAAHTLDDALALAVALEETDLEDLYDDLVLQGEPAFRLICERIEAALSAKPASAPAAPAVRRTRPKAS
jgi:rubrerythrin